MTPRRLAALVLGAALAAGCGPDGANPAPIDEAAEQAVTNAPRAPAGPTLLVDPDGFFVSAESVEGDWWGGDGVPCLVEIREGTDAGRLAGRIDTDAPMLWTREGDAPFEAREAAVQPRAEPLREEVRDALRAGGASGITFYGRPRIWQAALDALSTRLAPSVPDPLPPPPNRPAPHEVSILPDGTPLLARVPPDALVAHARSVEAGFRFADVAVDLARRLLPPGRARRDHQTLRLTLHHLLLPTIWRANPGGEKGVSEAAVVLFPPLRPGRLDAGVLMRITNAEEHRMDTIAGVAIEARPEHLWRPEGDPFPDLRARDNARTEAGDVEVVATGAPVLRRLARRSDRGEDALTPEAIAARHGLPPSPGRSRALVVEIPPGMTVTTAEPGPRRSAAALLERWSGLAVDPFETSVGGDLAGWDLMEPVAEDNAPWVAVRAASVDTDIRGAAVAVRLDDEAAATALVELLSRGAPGPRTCRRACRANLAGLLPLGLVERRASDVAERCFVWFGWRPVCFSGGTYRFHPITGEPSCSAHGPLRDPHEAGGAPPSPISDVARDGSLVTFRLSIDW